jgi:hypothetical protein
MSVAMQVGHCTNCGKQTLVGPLHEENGGPLFCLPCGSDWHAQHGRRRKLGRIVIKAMKAYFAAGGRWDTIDRLKLAAAGISLFPGEADTLGVEVGDITTELLDATLRLTHPDRHPPERQEEANRVTQELLALKPYVFPSLKSKQPTAQPAQEKRVNRRLDEMELKPLRASFPCEICVDEVPAFYCAPCKAEWKRRRQQEREAERAKRRAQYQQRKQIRCWWEKPKTCPVCGQSFKGKRKDSVYCSDACRQRGHRQRVTDTVKLRAQPLKSRNGCDRWDAALMEARP